MIRTVVVDDEKLARDRVKTFLKKVSDVELVGRVRLQPDTRHHFVVENGSEVDTVRLDVYPDGGIARLRVWGELV